MAWKLSANCKGKHCTSPLDSILIILVIFEHSSAEVTDSSAVSSSESGAAPAYHSKDYWNDRYEKEAQNVKNNGNNNENNNSNSHKVEIYEWYVPFDKISSMLSREIQSIVKKRCDKACIAMVPGCGNSLLAEDLIRAGATTVVGIDYSSVIVDKMNERLKEKDGAVRGVEYREVSGVSESF